MNDEVQFGLNLISNAFEDLTRYPRVVRDDRVEVH